MPSSGGYTKITSDIILDDTIVDADIKATANITRSKMNEAQDVLIKTGAKLQVNEAANVNNVQVTHDGTQGNIITSAGALVINAFTGVVSLLKAGVNGILKIYGSGGVNRLDISHNNTDGVVLSQVGDLILGGANIRSAVNYLLRNGAKLLFYRGDNTLYSQVYRDDASLKVDGVDKGIYIISGDGTVGISKGGINSRLNIYDSTEAKRVSLIHNGVAGVIETNSDGLMISPATSVDFNNKPVTNANYYEVNGAIYYYKSVGGIEFKGVDTHAISVLSPNWADNTVAMNCGMDDCWSIHNLQLVKGSTITLLWTRYRRNDAACTGFIILEAINKMTGALIEMARVNFTDLTGAFVSDTDGTIATPTVDTDTYSYRLRMYLNTGATANRIYVIHASVTGYYNRIGY